MATAASAAEAARSVLGAELPRHSGGAGEDWHSTAQALVRELERGTLALPLPGGGRTWERWEVLRQLGRRDLSLARLAEGHTDAHAILAELGRPSPRWPQIWGVWAEHPPGHRLRARKHGTQWRLHGSKPRCPGARTCTHALVTADLDTGERCLFSVSNHDTTAYPEPRAAGGMPASDTLTLTFPDTPATFVGAADSYTDRPGFHHGGAGAAACWYGGAQAVADRLAQRARAEDADPGTLAHYGAVVRDMRSTHALLRLAAQQIDDDPEDRGGKAAERALWVRSAVAAMCWSVLGRSAEALGTGAFDSDVCYARASADLSVYIRQHHGDRDLARLGMLKARREREADNDLSRATDSAAHGRTRDR